MLTIALPKGRIAEETLEIFAEIFGGEFKFEGRELILDKGGFRFLNVRNQDVPTYVEHGAADLGVVGLDVITEKEPKKQAFDDGLADIEIVNNFGDAAELDWKELVAKYGRETIYEWLIDKGETPENLDQKTDRQLANILKKKVSEG